VNAALDNRRELMQLPQVISIVSSPAETPDVECLTYDQWTLRITVRHKDGLRYVEFAGVIGFRMLDEGDLTEFWNPRVRAEGWLWQVKAGGWLDLEAIRSGFMHHPDGKEYLILGLDGCVSVLSKSAPVIREPALLI
jgi:hypothetical protein